ncbi:DEAD/DEAH box helicase family protein [Microbacterium sp. SD291]|uniref:restriction endonuclease n=1 Tax=Microbacterium sp. SD291 TaxID=2782007 RepID=UPI001A961888|nr:DEAD/DEAH box helicase family protein [Microbacterium sp. SD291]MBO0982187.1 DEAD/DEAH box helicase family protein [Microbacterium sp. SD291]
MSSNGFQFDASQQYQLDAIASVTGLFRGQPHDAEQLKRALGTEAVTASGQGRFDLEEVGAVGNSVALDKATIISNLRRVQDHNGLEVQDALFDASGLDFDIEMETGTGKTYVYLRTIFELAKQYNFTKFVILVPSVAIREGVNTSIRLMREHFEHLYKPHGITFDSSVYSGERPDEVRSFATATNVQILVMTIDAIRGDKNTRVIRKARNQLGGLKPIDYLAATRPIVIMDEPQNMESKLSQSAIGDLEPSFTLRYSATHKTKRNVVYRLDPVDAHDLGLVKQIAVADAHQEGADVTPYVKLVGVQDSPWSARLELSVRSTGGSPQRKIVTVKQIGGRWPELSDPKITDNPAYNGWRIIEVRNDPPLVELTNVVLLDGESVGGSTGAIYKEMIRETVKEHLRKMAMLRSRDIKVLSLFFVDKVASFLGDGVNNESADGDFARWFDEVFTEERARNPKFLEMLPGDPRDYRRAYFSELRKGVFGDTTGSTKKDDDAYELIMRDKEGLLDEAQPVRFIFSHSALREGWDNPNVFQICTLREMGAETERRQTLGRGLRLPVAKTEDGFVRIPDRSIATLTVIANESVQQFAKNLQTEFQKEGVEVGRVRKNEFSKILWRSADGAVTEELFGYDRSVSVFEHLVRQKFIDDKGQVAQKFQPHTIDFSLHLPEIYVDYEPEIIQRIAQANLGTYIKPVSNRAARAFNKELYATEEFEQFWETISRRTTYRVSAKRKKIIKKCVSAIRAQPRIEPLRIEVTRASVTIHRGGAKAVENAAPRTAEMRGAYDLPDIITELQDATRLTRRTIVDILLQSGRLEEFITNPNDVIAMMKGQIQIVLAKLILDGIQYEPIAGSVYELRELRKDGADEKEYFLDHLYAVKNKQKTDFDHVVFDAGYDGPERKFAELLDAREDIKLFMKLPPKFRIDTPVGPYNPDWAIIKQEGGEDRIYMIRETKSTLDESKRRPSENAKIKAAHAHFAAIGVVDYGVSVPETWGL